MCNKLNTLFFVILFSVLIISLSGCSSELSDLASDENVDLLSEAISDYVDSDMLSPIIEENETLVNEAEKSESIDVEPEVIEESLNLVPFDTDNNFSYCNQPICHYDKDTNTLNYTIDFNSVPKSDDQNIYLFEFANYEQESSINEKAYFTSLPKSNTVTFSFSYRTEFLFSRFVPAIIYDNTYYPLSTGQYVTNPEDIANNNTPYPDIPSKKGILLDPLTIDKEELTDLNVKRAVFNIPLSFIMGESDNEALPTVNYSYKGQVYHFNRYMLAGFDSVFQYLTVNNYHITAIVLNDWNTIYPELIHPKSRNRTSQSMYYSFNTEDPNGVRAMEAAALFLADRYSGNNYGLIHDWVIANEINQQKIWNYMATDDIDLYVTSFEKSFRTFYNAIKSRYSNAKIYYSVDQAWNDNNGINSNHFNGKEVVDLFNSYAIEHGNYDWSLSIHPYPYPLTKTKFWNGTYDKSENAAIVTPMNLSAVTDYMTTEDLRDTNGNVRQIGVTELGFSSKIGEKYQAAAFAYCYYIINNNPYINSFLLNRQTDTYDSLKSKLALGIYNPDYSPKILKDVFANIDTDEGENYIPEMLEIIGIDSLDNALELAK